MCSCKSKNQLNIHTALSVVGPSSLGGGLRNCDSGSVDPPTQNGAEASKQGTYRIGTIGGHCQRDVHVSVVADCGGDVVGEGDDVGGRRRGGDRNSRGAVVVGNGGRGQVAAIYSDDGVGVVAIDSDFVSRSEEYELHKRYGVNKCKKKIELILQEIDKKDKIRKKREKKKK